jgi:hypothetical protein
MKEVFVFASCVDDDIEMVASIGDHQVVEDTAIVIGEKAVALATGLQPYQIDRDKTFERQRGVLVVAGAGSDDHLAHVGDVEEAGGRAGVQVFLQYAGGILHGHVVARERNHAGSERHMKGVQGGLLQGSGLVQMTPPGLRFIESAAQNSGAVLRLTMSPLCPFA